MIALNAETYARDLADLASGGYFIYDSTWPRAALLKRDDVTVIGVPLARLCNDNFRACAPESDEEHLLRRRAGGAAATSIWNHPRRC